MKSQRRSSWAWLAGLTLGAGVLAYSVHLAKQVGVLKASLRRPRLFDDNFHSQKLGRYYYSFFPSYKQPEFGPPEVDEKGIPVSDYSHKVLIRGVMGRHYNPLTVAHWALGAYDDYLATGDLRCRELFLRRADWLVDNQRPIQDGAVVWYHTAGWGRSKRPWASAMAQGFALSGLCRAYQETGDEKYMETARRALRAMDIPVSQGGLAARDATGNVFYEEWAFLPAIHILNGHIFALFGLHDYYRATGDEHARELFEAGVDAVRQRLPDFDLGFWSRYSLDRPHLFNHWTVAAPIYQQVHIDLLRFIYKITGDDIFARYADRWEAQQRTPVSELLNVLFVLFKDLVRANKYARALWGDLRARFRAS